uniref:3-isopropylmalate dehydratase small subunit n=1 Tax=Paulinella chromatophora TaxID=39717 RepID=B1X4T5_PAUCH|nr:3-isopropylmalate dehydratase small subunit [Paulinella chromatophora]ACB42954.1 3-isopropylmalate dehydratase small subunit [Paulinella chromatophora]
MSTVSIPFGLIKTVSGPGIVLKGDDIDTDRIIPARFLKCVNFDRLGEQVFADDRVELKGHHPFDCNNYDGAKILFVNSNFGCGSSREHAPQALLRWGIRAIVGESFAEIFFGNCLAIGIPCFTGDRDTIIALQSSSLSDSSVNSWTLDVSQKKILGMGQSWILSLDDGARHMLLSGSWNTTAQLVASNSDLDITSSHLPYLSAFC